jgi:hypothetical protein
MKQETIKAFPLSWPSGYKRSQLTLDSRFRQTPAKAVGFLRDELHRLGAKNIVISSNAPLKNNGEMYSDAMGRQADSGVAVYFNYKDRPVVLCCDTYSKIWENCYAIGLTVENLRAIERYGVSDFLSRSFTGFAQIPESFTVNSERSWWEVLCVSKNADMAEVKKAYRMLAVKLHPDTGGDARSEDEFRELNEAYEEAKRSLNSIV